MALTKYISEKRLFILLLLLSLVPVWIVPYFLTADGPCHAWNARILYDILHGHADFYKAFYYVNPNPEPNWFSHIFLAAVYHVAGPVLADKLIISLSILLFTTGFRKLLLSLSKENALLSLWVFPFIWQNAMLMGFYNYMLSIGCSFWISAWFISNYKQLSFRKTALFALSLVVVYSMHLFGCFITFIICGLFILIDDGTLRSKLRPIALLATAAVPALILIAWYITGNSSSTNNAGRPPGSELLANISNLNSLFGLTATDIRLSMKMSSLLQLFILAGAVLFIFKRPKRQVIVPLFLFLLFTGAYFLIYETTFGGSYIRQRLEPLAYLAGIMLISFAHLHRLVSIASAVLAVLFTLAFTYNKLPAWHDASLFVSEIREASTYIKDKNLVLPLNCERYLRNKDSVVINNNVLLFAHVAEFMPHNKKLVFMDNYEATTGYFPLIWRSGTNPFIHLAVGDGIEGEPPQVNIHGYNKNVHPIRYILLWGKKKEAIEHPEYPKLIQMVTENYKLVYTSPVYKIGLYELK